MSQATKQTESSHSFYYSFASSQSCSIGSGQRYLGSAFITNVRAYCFLVSIMPVKQHYCICSSNNRLLLSEPTRFPHDEEITIGNIRFKAHDVGGHTAARRLWKQYMTAINGIIFIIDSTDYKRFFEAKNELYKLLNDENLQEIPFLILGSKFDSPIAVTEIQLRAELGLEQTSGKDGSKLYHNKQPVELFMSSVVKRTGYQDGFNWLNQHIK